MFKQSANIFYGIKRNVHKKVVASVGSILAFVLVSGIFTSFRWPVFALGAFQYVDKKTLGNKRWLWKRKVRRI